MKNLRDLLNNVFQTCRFPSMLLERIQRKDAYGIREGSLISLLIKIQMHFLYIYLKTRMCFYQTHIVYSEFLKYKRLLKNRNSVHSLFGK